MSMWFYELQNISFLNPVCVRLIFMDGTQSNKKQLESPKKSCSYQIMLPKVLEKKTYELSEM